MLDECCYRKNASFTKGLGRNCKVDINVTQAIVGGSNNFKTGVRKNIKIQRQLDDLGARNKVRGGDLCLT